MTKRPTMRDRIRVLEEAAKVDAEHLTDLIGRRARALRLLDHAIESIALIDDGQVSPQLEGDAEALAIDAIKCAAATLRGRA